jgi:LAGLIDADG-like domain
MEFHCGHEKKTHKVGLDQYPIIFDKYLAGKTISELGSEYGVTPQAIYGLLKRNDVPIRSQTQSQRKYKLNESVFDQIDTEEKAYLYGFIVADGYNNVERGVLSIHLHNRDKDILIKSKKVLGSSIPLKNTTVLNKSGNKTPVVYLRVYSKLLSNRLVELGMNHEKFRSFKFPHWLNQSLYRHFLRGYMDGDGTIISSKNSERVSVSGTKSFCESVIKIIKTECGIKQIHMKTSDQKGYVSISISRENDLISLFRYLYADTKIFGSRREAIFKHIVERIQNKQEN